MSVDAEIPASTDLLGKTVADLQENIVIGHGTITGTLKYLNDYTGYPGGADEQVGNYLILRCSAADGAKIEVKLEGGPLDWQELDEDGLVISRITDKDGQTIKVRASLEGETGYETEEFSLSGLVLEEE